MKVNYQFEHKRPDSRLEEQQRVGLRQKERKAIKWKKVEEIFEVPGVKEEK